MDCLSNELLIDVYLRMQDFNRVGDFPFRAYEEKIIQAVSDEGEHNDVTIRFIPCQSLSNTIQITIIPFVGKADYLNQSDLDEVIRGCLEEYFQLHEIPIETYYLTQSSQSAVIFSFRK